jgi:hypothetical protein
MRLLFGVTSLLFLGAIYSMLFRYEDMHRPLWDDGHPLWDLVSPASQSARILFLQAMSMLVGLCVLGVTLADQAASQFHLAYFLGGLFSMAYQTTWHTEQFGLAPWKHLAMDGPLAFIHLLV